ncbi:putative cytokinetic ring protein SteA [Aquipuribacter sp. SD81]|uniref:putative cytokinetic ring protein SteA n=1 Tax=Aquipuribacter sp. SD81 TaxID=3127703 RepID=UPI0030178C0B
MLRAPRRRTGGADAGVVGTARVLHGGVPTARLRPGDVAVVDVRGLDGRTAAALAARRPAAVLNASPSCSRTWPNPGPRVLLEAGVPLVDDLGPDLLAVVVDGVRVRVHDGRVELAGRRRGGTALSGTAHDEASLEAAAEHGRAGTLASLEAFAASTAHLLTAQGDLLLDGAGVPHLPVDLAGRPVVVVTRGYGWAEDLRLLRRFLHERRPVLVGVEDGADALLARGMRPHLVVTAGWGASETALLCGAHVVVHTPAADDLEGDGEPDATGAPDDGRSRAAEVWSRSRAAGVRASAFASGLSGEDTALVLAHAHGALPVVTVGSHTTLGEFLDRDRAGMASSFLTRLRTAPVVVDAPAAAALHQPRVSWAMAVTLLLAAVLVLGCALAATPWGQDQLAALSGLAGAPLGADRSGAGP